MMPTVTKSVEVEVDVEVALEDFDHDEILELLWESRENGDIKDLLAAVYPEGLPNSRVVEDAYEALLKGDAARATLLLEQALFPSQGKRNVIRARVESARASA